MYKELLDALSQVQGKFLLSSYHSDILERYTAQNGWHRKEISKPLIASCSKDGKPRKRKIEVLKTNYPLTF